MAEESPASAPGTGAAEIIRLEKLSRRAWPALEDEVKEVSGWVLGTSGSYTRRANCVVPLALPGQGLDECVGRVESFYQSRGRPAVFKLQPAAEPRELDAFLDARGYERASETIVMTRHADPIANDEADPWKSEPADRIRVELERNRLDSDWLSASVALSAVDADRAQDYRAILEKLLNLQGDSIFGRLECEGRILSVALGCLVDDAVSFVQVATAPEARGQRFAERVLREILAAANESGSPTGLLSVEADNASARKLYDRLGFIERYRYWYREQR